MVLSACVHLPFHMLFTNLSVVQASYHSRIPTQARRGLLVLWRLFPPPALHKACGRKKVGSIPCVSYTVSRVDLCAGGSPPLQDRPFCLAVYRGDVYGQAGWTFHFSAQVGSRKASEC